MSKNQTHNRRKFLAGAGVVATVAAVAANAQEAGHSHHGNSGFTPARHAEDSWMDEMGGIHRVFVDSSTGPGGIAAMNFASNILLAHAQGYGGTSDARGRQGPASGGSHRGTHRSLQLSRGRCIIVYEGPIKMSRVPYSSTRRPAHTAPLNAASSR